MLSRFPGISDSEESACNVGDLGSIPGLGRHGLRRVWQPTEVFLLGESPWPEEPTVLGVAKSQTRLSTHIAECKQAICIDV